MGKRTVLAMATCAAVAVAISVPAGAMGPASSSGGKLPLLIANCAKPKFKPANVIFTCGDASFGATGVTWSSWTRKVASGGGTGEINDCKPNCASGKTKTGPITLRASKPQTCKNGKRVFTKLSYTWTEKAPVGNVPDQGSFPVGCKLAGL
jgi:hypothetical protein